MLLFIWMCVVTQAFMPQAGQIFVQQARAIEAHLMAELEEPRGPSQSRERYIERYARRPSTSSALAR